jgi:hypothetical protein
VFHFIIKLDIFNKLKESFIFSFNNRYLANVFYNIISDTEAAGVFIIREPKFKLFSSLIALFKLTN